MAEGPTSPGKARARRTRVESRAARATLPAVEEFMVALEVVAKRTYTTKGRLHRGTVTGMWEDALEGASDALYSAFDAEAARKYMASMETAAMPGYAYETTQEILNLSRAGEWTRDETYALIEKYLDPHEGGPAVAAIGRARDEIPSKALAGSGEGWEAATMRDIRTITTEVVALQDIAEMRRLGIPFKQWVARHDPRTRESHARADGQVVPVESDFTVGGAKLFVPGDPEGPFEETLNCRCIVIASPTMTAY